MTRRKRRKYDAAKHLEEEEDREGEGEGGGMGASQSKKASKAPKAKAKKAESIDHALKDPHSQAAGIMDEASREMTTGTNLLVNEKGQAEIQKTFTRQRSEANPQKTKGQTSAPIKPSSVSRKATKTIGSFFDYPVTKTKALPKLTTPPSSSGPAANAFILSRTLNVNATNRAAISRQRREAELQALRRAEKNPAKPILISDKLKRSQTETVKSKSKPRSPEV